MSTNSRSVAGLGEMQNVVVLSQQNLRGQSSANITEIPNNLDTTNQLMDILMITPKIWTSLLNLRSNFV